MKTLLFSFLFYAAVTYSAPVHDDSTDKKAIDTKTDRNTKENDNAKEARAGIIDSLNPFNNNNAPTSDKDNGQSNNNPLSGIPNLFNISSNPFSQLSSPTSGNGNFLNDIKIFFVGSQGMVLPASAVFGGFQNFIQAMGNMGNLVQGVQNLIPSLPGS